MALAAAKPRDPRAKLVQDSHGEILEVIAPQLTDGNPEFEQLREGLKATLAAGVTSVAVVLLHSYAYPEHERQFGALCTKLGFTHVSLSSAYSDLVVFLCLIVFVVLD